MRLILAALFLMGPVYGFQTTQEELTVVFRDVRLHVVDKDGEPVYGLKPEDFVLTEDKQPRNITFFEEVGRPEGEGASESMTEAETSGVSAFQGESNVVIVLDSSHMRADAFTEFKTVIKRFINENVGPNHLVKIVQVEDRLIHLTSFVKNKNIMLEAIDSAEYKGSLLRKIRSDEIRIADAFSFYLEPVLGQDAETANLPLENDYLYELRQAVRSKEMAKRDQFIFFKNVMGYLSDVLRQMSGSKTIYLFTGGGFIHKNESLVTPSSDLSQRMGRDLNSSNVTVNTFLHVPRKSVFDDMANIDQVRLRDRPNPLPELGSEFKLVDETIFENVMDLVKAPLDATENTGGQAQSIHGLANIQAEFDAFMRKTSHFYRLGYTLSSPEKKSKLKVKLAEKHKGWKLYYGDRFEPVKNYLDMDEKQRAVSFESSLVYNSSFRNDLDCDWGFHGFEGIDKGEIVSVYAELGQRPFPKNGYEVGFAALNDVRVMVDFSKSTVLSADHDGGSLFYDVLMPVARPTYIRYQVIDLDTGEKSQFELPYKRKDLGRTDRFHIAGLTLAEESTSKVFPLNHLRDEGETPDFGKSLTAMRRDYDPFNISNRLFIPALDQAFAPTEELHVYFQLKEAKYPAGEYNIVHQLVYDNKEIFPSNLVITEVSSPEKGVFRCRGLVKTEGLKPGSYKFMLKAQKANGIEKAVAIHEFTVVEP